MKQLNRKPLFNAISLAVAGTAMAAMVVLPAQAQEGYLEEIVVTSQKRTENLQDVGLSIQVLDNKQLEELQVKGFADYILWMPTVSYTSNGPGYAKIYMRGIASGGDGVHSGSMPSVGVYLDEQPITTINQVLNVHVYDIERIETLSGPQGSLYGQGSQAGTIRILTNKPEIGVNEGGYDIYADTTKSGDPGFGLEGFINIPINDRMAVRLVGWYEQQGGYIDNVFHELTYAASGITIDNADIVEENFNTSEVAGLRALLKIDLSDDWTLTPGIMYQKGESEGLWRQTPELAGDLETITMFPTFQDEDWYQASLTLDGKVGSLDLVYAGAYLDRNVDSQYDYTGYAEYLEYVYAGYGYYCLYYDALGDCADGSQYVDGDEEFTRQSHELRLQSSQDQRFRWIAGLFYQKQEHLFDLRWTVPDLNPAQSTVENSVVVWQTHQDRIDRDKAAFGEVYFDLTDSFTLIGGVRVFDYENSLFGFNGFIRHCTGIYDANGDFIETPADEGGVPQFPCFNTGILDDVSEGDDVAFKGSVEWTISDDKMVYATYSEGFRAGGVNRARVEGIPKYEPDWVYNYEIGWKTPWADGRFRFNGAAYIEDWEDFQFGFLDFTISNLTIIQNVGNSRTKGVEWDMDFAASENLTLSLQGSYNDAKLREDFWKDDEDRENGEPPNSPEGLAMPYVPKWQMTGIGRFNFNMGDLPSFAQVAVSYRDSIWSDLDVFDYRRKMDSYTVLNLSAGVERDNWSVTLYANNVTDERGLVDLSNPGYGVPPGLDWTENMIRPRNFGIRWSQRFGGEVRASSPAPAPLPASAPVAPPPNPDLDGDGVLNEKDKCPNTRPGAVVDLDGCEVEAVIALDNVHFDFDQATLRPEAMTILDNAANLLKTQEKVVVEVAGHTDSAGSEAYNQGLSERRAIAVKDYLEGKGVTATRLTARGYGEAQPVASNDTDEGRALNRRVELIVLER
ncbi:MAG TPA: TonB-dependent receptor [Xanthomonadales bacterium]|nr:TonB-dependent receptor [Xanthomonadales bacterium]